MLPPALFSSYTQYKQDTNSVAAWLASTAKAYGYASELLHPSAAAASSKPSGRLKGKARAQAKKKGGASSASASTKLQPSLPKYIIKIKDFVPLAEFIAGKALLSVPASFRATLDRVIAKRTGFSDTLKEQGSAPDKNSDKTHEYFVGILQKVRDVLKPRMAPTPATTAARSEDLSNQFASLELHEPSEEFLNAPDVIRPSNAEGDEAVYEAEPQDSFEEFMIALTMIVNDLNSIRSYVEWIWSNYKTGVFDLTAAAIATNTAVDLGRNLLEDVEPLFKLHGGTWKVLNLFYQVTAMMQGHSILDLFTDGPDNDNFNYETYDIAEGTYILTFRLVDGFLRVLQPGQLPIYKDGMFGHYDASTDRKSKSGFEKFVEDRALLMPFFTELMTVVRGIGDYPVEDEFLRGMREMNETKEVPFYLVFAAQVFLDIHHTIRGHTERGFATLTDQLKFFNRELDEHFEFHQNLKIDNWPASNDHMLRQVQAKINWISSDPIYKVKSKTYRTLGVPIPDTVKPNRILIMSPVLSGLMLYHFRAEMYDIGIALANAWGSITYAAHLYNAVEHEKLVQAHSWPDMDIVRTSLGDSNFFVGEPPQNVAEYFKRFCLQMGVSAATMTNRRRGKVALGSKSGPRGIKEGAPVSRMFMDRYLRKTGQVDWTPEHIDQIVDLSMWEAEGSEEDGTLMMGQIDDPDKIEAKKQLQREKEKKRRQQNRKKATEGGLLPPEKLVRALVFALHSEALEFSLPYMAMHRECWRALRAARLRCDPLLRQRFTPAYMERESELPFVVGYIFMAAAENLDGRLLAQAAEALDGFVRVEGQGVLRALRGLGFPVEFVTEEEFEARKGAADGTTTDAAS